MEAMKSPCTEAVAVLEPDGRISVGGTYPQTTRWPTGVDRWRSIIDEVSERRGVPQAIIAAFMAVESGGDANAVSWAGALGLMQLMPETYNGLAGIPAGTPVDKDAATEPFVNVDLGAKLIASNLKRYNGNLVSSAAAYNAGKPRCGVYCRKKKDGTIVCCDEDQWGLKTDCGYVNKILAAYNTAVAHGYSWQQPSGVVGTIKPVLLAGWESGSLRWDDEVAAKGAALGFAIVAVATGGLLIAGVRPWFLGGKGWLS